MQRILVLISLCFSCNLLAAEPIPIIGKWQIVSYQIIGYPEMDEVERNNWLGNIIEFNQEIILSNGKTSYTCPKFDYQVTTENSEAHFLTGYKIKPHQLGIVEKTIELIKVTCQTNSWLSKSRWFIKVSDVHMLGYWDGVLFFFIKQNKPNILLITPQSVGMINSKSHFDSEILTTHFPKYTIDKDFKFYQQKKLMLEIYPNNLRISHINIFDENAIAPANAKIGMTYTDIFNNPEIIIDCEAGIRELVEKTICSFKNIPTIKYIFKPQTGAPPIEALENAKLIEFIWFANPSLMEEKKSPNRFIPEDIPTGDNLKTQMTRLANIQNHINRLLEKLPNDDFSTAILDFNNTQQAWMEYSNKHCQWYSTFFDVAKDICIEKMAQEQADEIKIILQKIETLYIVTTE